MIALVGGVLIILVPEVGRANVTGVGYVDAAALALFAVAGAAKAHAFASNLVVVTILGTITAVGGGALRDILLAREPLIMTASVYAAAAAAGALVVGGLLRLRAPIPVAMVAGGVICFGLRVGAIVFGWNVQFVR